MPSFYKKYILIALLPFITMCYAGAKKPNFFDVEIIVPAAQHSANKLLSTHKPIYLMPVHLNRDVGTSTYFKNFAENRSKEGLEFNPNKEVAFQWSGKILVATNKKMSLYIAYNQEAHWQFWTIDPYFRSIDHQIEFFVDYPLLINNKTFALRVGHVHRSNGLGLNITTTDWDTEKGWDRAYASIKYDDTKYSILLKLWHVLIIQRNALGLPEIGKYNPDIANFLGYGKLTFMYRFSKNHFFTISKHLFDKSSCYGASLKSTWELNYFVPVLPAIQLIFKGFSGYGKNMITYDAHTFGAGIGIALCFD